jgi:hypothetical protein
MSDMPNTTKEKMKFARAMLLLREERFSAKNRPLSA